jgi:hypothetical protein
VEIINERTANPDAVPLVVKTAVPSDSPLDSRSASSPDLKRLI